LERYRQRKMGIRRGTLHVGSLFRAGSLKTVASELAKCKLDLVAVKEVRCDKNGSQSENSYTFF